MKKLEIFEPAMCCSTGVCGPSVDKELLRISLVFNKLEKDENLSINRFNLSSSPQEFMNNKVINKIINENGVDDLPVTIVDGKVIKRKEYPTNDELANWLALDKKVLEQAVQKPSVEL
ncbi:MAG TPA: arsenite efflux transporter metallochaperone ArsD [Clostridia bacterium]|nr:arsenite efflux transporter metallochaperone ArsD [Clostridia bacterium]